jgi:hypothetical protein
VITIDDKVRLTRVPPWMEAIPNEKDEMATKRVFRECVGRVFEVRGIGTDSPHENTWSLELWIRQGADCDYRPKADSIWIDPGYVELVADARD